MLLICTRGHKFDTSKNIWHRGLKPGDKCPMLLSYDRVGGSSYCGRVLREL